MNRFDSNFKSNAQLGKKNGLLRRSNPSQVFKTIVRSHAAVAEEKSLRAKEKRVRISDKVKSMTILYASNCSSDSKSSTEAEQPYRSKAQCAVKKSSLK